MPRTPDTVYVGIDPGASGGLVALRDGWPITPAPMPETEGDVWQWVKARSPLPKVKTVAVIEQVGGFMGGGDAGPFNKASAHTMFKFGHGYGGLRMALTAAGIPFEAVTPQKWQKALGIPPRKKTESKTAWKNRLKGFAQRAFPEVRVTLAVADALLIALYCKRKHEGTL